MALNANKTGLTVGLITAGIHAIWSIIVALGFGQSVVDWAMSLHFLQSMYTLTDFRLRIALLLVLAAFAGGYGFGWLFAIVYNKLNKK